MTRNFKLPLATRSYACLTILLTFYAALACAQTPPGPHGARRRQFQVNPDVDNTATTGSPFGNYHWELGLNVTLDYGTFIGSRNETTGILSWKGVKYADGTGERRFRSPTSPPKGHLGVVNASDFGPICIQAGQSEVVEDYSEDCLFGNIFVPPGTRISDKLPVLVYYHGGGFQSGNTRRFQPSLLYKSSKKPFIFVAFSYRLGAFGFLGGSQVADDGFGNAAFHDQWTSLRWVRRYIRKFGGNPHDVTIWGQSAGATITMSALVGFGGKNDGLFKRVIGDSPALNFFPHIRDQAVNDLFNQYASFANCSGPEALECLRSANVSTLTLASNKTLDARPKALYPFSPITDGRIIRERPSVAFKSGRIARVPVIFGTNTDEGVGWSNRLPDDSVNTSRSDASQNTLFNFVQGQWPGLKESSFQKIQELYPLNAFKNLDDQTALMYGEARYICTAKLITGAARKVGKTGYGYHYDNADEEGFTRHQSELVAYYDEPEEESSGLFPAMREFYTSFVTEGKPCSDSEPEKWKPVNSRLGKSRIFLHPGEISMEGPLPDLEKRCELWRSLDDEMIR